MTAQNATRAPRAARGCPLRGFFEENPEMVSRKYICFPRGCGKSFMLQLLHQEANEIRKRRIPPCCKH